MNEEYDELRKSKSQVKREMRALRDLGKQLVELPPGMLVKFMITESLHDAILHAQGLKREALRRQLQHIGKLLRDEDADAIQSTLDHLSQPHREEVRAFHEVENWRDQLISGNDEIINQIIARFKNADRQHLRQLVRNARKEKNRDKPPKSARVLFQYLTDLHREED